MANIEKGKGKILKISVDSGHYAVLVEDPINMDSAATNAQPPVYDEPVRLPGVQTVGVTSGDTQVPVQADGITLLAVVSKGPKTLNLIRTEFSNEELEVLQGLGRDERGLLVESGNSHPIDVAFGYRREKHGGHFDYFWYVKGIISVNEDTTNTRQPTFSEQPWTAAGTFTARQSDNIICIKMSTDDEKSYDADLANKWFTAETLNKLVVLVQNGTTGPGGGSGGSGNMSINANVAAAQAELDKAIAVAQLEDTIAAKDAAAKSAKAELDAAKADLAKLNAPASSAK